MELTKHERRWHQPYLWYDYIEHVADHTLHVVVVDTEALEERVNNYTAMQAWLNDTLAASRADWKIVVGHRTIYSAGAYGPATNSTLVRNFHRPKLCAVGKLSKKNLF